MGTTRISGRGTLLRIATAVALGVATALAAPTMAAPIGYGVEEATQDLYRINLQTGAATRVGPTGGTDIEGLSFNPITGILYGIDDRNSSSTFGNLVTINTQTGAATVVGSLGRVIADPGLTFDSSGRLWAAGEDGTAANDDVGFFFSINLQTGAATLVGRIGYDVEGLGAIGNLVYGITDDSTGNSSTGSGQTLVQINTTTGVGTFIGKTGIDSDDEIGMEGDGRGGLVVSNEEHQTLYRVNPLNANATLIGNMQHDFEGLATIPEPGTLALLGLGITGLALRSRRRA